jgi:hypothetical protein
MALPKFIATKNAELIHSTKNQYGVIIQSKRDEPENRNQRALAINQSHELSWSKRDVPEIPPQ